MITVNIGQLMSAIEEAESLRLPDMNKGTGYLYNKLYKRLEEGSELRLSEIDFGRFELGDIDSIREMHSGIEINGGRARALIWALRSIPPAASAAAFI